MKCLVTGAGGFIGGHLAAALREDGHEVTGVDIKSWEDWYQPGDENDDWDDTDLSYEACPVYGYDRVYHLAANMGGMGFISSHRVACMESVKITMNILEAAYRGDVDRVFYASSACVYPEHHQLDPDNPGLKESMAWPADPEPGYGLEKLYGEQLCQFWSEEYGLNTRVARFHNIFGPYGTYDGGREKAPAAICRKIAQAKKYGGDTIEIWGDGEQSRSFLYVDECVEGTRRLTESGVTEPLNVGSDELVTINQLVDMVEGIARVKLKREYQLDKPQGVRGRNSDNDLIQERLGWAPSAKLIDGLEKTYAWIYDQI